jgi:hypothetical protein
MQLEPTEQIAIVSYTGAIQLPPAEHEQYIKRSYASLLQFREELQEMLREPYLLDDAVRGSVEQFATLLSVSFDVLIWKCSGASAIVLLTGIVPSRHAAICVWFSDQRTTEHDIMITRFLEETVANHIWNSLQLIRVQAHCATVDKKTLSSLYQIGLTPCGSATMQLKFCDELFDTVMLEFINPKYSQQRQSRGN